MRRHYEVSYRYGDRVVLVITTASDRARAVDQVLRREHAPRESLISIREQTEPW